MGKGAQSVLRQERIGCSRNGEEASVIAEQGARGQVIHGQHLKGPGGPQKRVTLMLNSARGQQNG